MNSVNLRSLTRPVAALPERLAGGEPPGPPSGRLLACRRTVTLGPEETSAVLISAPQSCRSNLNTRSLKRPVIEKILAHLGLVRRPPPEAPARESGRDQAG